METTVIAPPLTNISPIASIAEHLNCIQIEDADHLPDGELRISREGDRIFWHDRKSCGVIGITDLLAIEIATATHGPSRFLAIVATFKDTIGPASYRMILGPESEAVWFNETIDRLRDVIWTDQDS
jgi:hypothetical protein